MLIQGIDCTVVYIDPGATGSNDGTTPADALTSLPDPDTFAADTVYLCRRGTSNINLSDGTVTNDNSYVFGMPKPGELFYDVAPSAAKSAWDADVADYANFISSGGAGIEFNQDFGGVFGIEFKQNGHTAYYNIINVTSTLSYGHFIIKCKFTDPSYDLTTSGSTSEQTTGSIYLRGDHIVVQDSHIERRAIDDDVIVNDNVNEYALYCEGDHVSINNVTVWAQSCSYDGAPSSITVGGIAVANSNDCSVNDTTVNVVMNGFDFVSDDASFLQAFYSYQNKLIKIRNLNLNVDRTIAPIVSGQVQTNNFFEIETINIDHTVVDIDGLYLDFSGMTSYDWSYSSFKYIDIFIEHNEDTSGGKESRIRNFSITNPPSVQESTIHRMIDIRVPGRCTLENLDFDIGRHAALIEASSASLTGEDSIRIKDLTMIGSLELKSVTFADINSITRDDASIPSNISSYPPLVLRRSNAHVKDIQLLDAWSSVTNTQIYTDFVCFLYVDNINVPLYYGIGNHSTYPFTTLYVNNIDGIDGNWYAANYRYRAQTNAAFRTGGANASLKFYSTASDLDNPLFIGNRPFPGIKLTPSSTGSHTITVYAAVKLFTTPTDIRKFFVILIDAPTTATAGVTTMYNSTVHGNWVEDNDSTWNNDDGLTQYKCEIPIEVDRLDDIEVRIMWNWWENTNGYLYLDPLFVLS